MPDFAQKKDTSQQKQQLNPSLTNTKTSVLQVQADPCQQLQRVIGNQVLESIFRTNNQSTITDNITPDSTTECNHTFKQVPECRNKTPIKIQKKLDMNTPGDTFEQEADLIADRIVTMPELENLHSVHFQPTEKNRYIQKSPEPLITSFSHQPQGDTHCRFTNIDSLRKNARINSIPLQNNIPIKHKNIKSPFIQRRIPEQSELSTLVSDRPAGAPPDRPGHVAGLRFLVERQVEELQALDTADGGDRMHRVRAHLPHNYTLLPQHEQLLEMSDAITTEIPNLQQGDPADYMIPPANPLEETRRDLLAFNTENRIFDPILSGSHNTDLAEVFGSPHNVTFATQKYFNGKHWMNEVKRRNRILTDRSGYAREAFLGGLTRPYTQIFVSPNVLDHPSNNNSVATMLHESMHVGNSSVVDHGYKRDPNFRELDEPTKLANAAHYEVIAWRILTPTDPQWQGVFTPAGQVGPAGLVTLSDTQRGMRKASEALRISWLKGLRLYGFFHNVYNSPTLWTQIYSGTGLEYRQFLPYWSFIENLTFHQRSNIQTTGADRAQNPISQIDMALSERVIRKMMLAKRRVPRQEAAASLAITNNQALLTGAATAVASIQSFIGPDPEDRIAAQLIYICLHNEGQITGPINRDINVVQVMSTTPYRDIFIDRSPPFSFP